MRASACEKKKQGCPNFLWLLFHIVTSAHIEQWDRPPPVQTGAHMSPVLCSVDGTSKRSLEKKKKRNRQQRLYSARMLQRWKWSQRGAICVWGATISWNKSDFCCSTQIKKEGFFFSSKRSRWVTSPTRAEWSTVSPFSAFLSLSPFLSLPFSLSSPSQTLLTQSYVIEVRIRNAQGLFRARLIISRWKYRTKKQIK